MPKGKFIVFEGLDGSGESTQAGLLTEYLQNKGHAVLLGKEPTGASAAGREVIEILTHKKTADSRRLQELFVEDRREHLERDILPAISAGKIVLEDRYVMSTYAFGSIECDLEWLIRINSGFLWPDATVYLKVRPEVSLARIATRGKPAELFEKKEKLQKVAASYEKLVQRFPDCFVVDGEKKIGEVHANIVEIIRKVVE